MLAALGIAAGSAVWLGQGSDAQPPATAGTALAPAVPAALASSAPAATVTAPRPRYAYSVVPGGVRSREELAQVIRSDKVVAAHYAGFRVEAARPVTVATPRAMYVSYRKGEHIFWTRQKVVLEPGEMLLSDGTHEIRARCANRLSDVAQFPVAQEEPATELLDSHVESDADGGALHNIAAPGTDGDPVQAPVRIVTFADGGAGPAQGDAAPASVLLPHIASQFGERTSTGTTSHSGSAVRIGGERHGSTGSRGTGGASSGPTGDTALSEDLIAAIGSPPTVLLPLVTPALPPALIPALEAGGTPELPPALSPPATAPPGIPELAVSPPPALPGLSAPPPALPGLSAPPLLPAPVSKQVIVPVPVALAPVTGTDPTGDGPLPGTEQPLRPPFDPARPILWPPQEPSVQELPLPHGEIPEPGTVWLVGAAVGMLAWRRRAWR